MNIILLGVSGSGKGTQAEMLAEKMGLYYFEAGKFLRNLAKTNKIVDDLINKQGKLVPTDQMFKYVSKDVKENTNFQNILFEGYPRSTRQYDLLKGLFKQKDSSIDVALQLDISEKEVVRRLSARRICDSCGENYNLITNPPPSTGCNCGGKLFQRNDDKPAAIKKRLEWYHDKTEPLIKVLEKEGKLIVINGARPIDVIHKDILERVQNAKN
jgi:adenylate kinase